MVLLYENTPAEIDFADKKDLARRLYKVVGLSSLSTKTNVYGRISIKYHQEARESKDVKIENTTYKNGGVHHPLIMLYHTQFNALVEGFGFHVNAIGDVELLSR